METGPMRPWSMLQTPCRTPPTSPCEHSDTSEVALVTHEFAPFRGGAATLVREIAHALAELTDGVEVWAPDYGKKPAEPLAEGAFCTRRWRNGGTLAVWDEVRLMLALARTLRRRRPWRLALLSVGALRAALRLRVWAPGLLPGRVTAVVHGSEILKFERRPVWSDRMRGALRAGWRAGCTTEAVERRLRATDWLRPDQPVLRLPCALPASIRAAALAGPARARTGGPFRLLTLARLHPRKGQLETAHALGRLPGELRRNLCWVLGGAGTADYRVRVLAAAQAAGVAVDDLGEVPEARLPEVYRGCDAYVMASRELPDSLEGFGLTFLEAGAFGLPVVGTRTGGVAEAVADGESGLLVPEGDLPALAEAVARLLREPALAQRLGANGRARALATSWRHAAENLLGERILC